MSFLNVFSFSGDSCTLTISKINYLIEWGFIVFNDVHVGTPSNLVWSYQTNLIYINEMQRIPITLNQWVEGSAKGTPSEESPESTKDNSNT